MTNSVQKIYATAIQQLPDSEKLQLASLILEKVTKKAESEKPRRKDGDITRFFGMFDSGNPNSADNDKIDADLARAYSDNHEDEN